MTAPGSSISLDLAETLDSPGKAHAAGSSTERIRADARKHVALVEGSSPHLSAETRDLLRVRLKMVALLLFGGFGVFYVWDLLVGPLVWDPVFVAQSAVLVVLGLSAVRLCSRCSFSLTTLRIAEAIVFGAPALFFMFWNYQNLRNCAMLADGHAHVPNIIGGWMLLIFCYALFVPNCWRRAAVVIGVLAALPLMVTLLCNFTCGHFAELIRTELFRGTFVEQTLAMMITAVTAVVGVHSINSLRSQAFAARQLGQYRLKERLGSGGMGEVYLAEHEMMKRPCAVKIIRPEKAGDPRALARFEREVRTTAKLSHWNSIDIFDYGRTDDGTFYYVMEYLPGHNLGELVEQHGPLPPERIVHLMRQVCDALAEAHGMGLVHRDIKPANIYCALRGGLFDVAKLLDFGLVKPPADTRDSGLTQEGAITGSPLFMSPEQAMGADEVDPRSDIYSLGAVMYYMATGSPPFEDSSAMKVLVAHASQDPEPPRLRRPALPTELEEIILRCMEKRPEDRFQTVVELAAELRRVPTTGEWSSEIAAQWWHEFGCPKRKALAAEVLELAAV